MSDIKKTKCIVFNFGVSEFYPFCYSFKLAHFFQAYFASHWKTFSVEIFSKVQNVNHRSSTAGANALKNGKNATRIHRAATPEGPQTSRLSTGWMTPWDWLHQHHRCSGLSVQTDIDLQPLPLTQPHTFTIVDRLWGASGPGWPQGFPAGEAGWGIAGHWRGKGSNTVHKARGKCTNPENFHNNFT